MKTHRINNLSALAPFSLFLLSYIPLFVILALRQITSNYEFLHWGGWSLDALICMLNNFGVASLCIALIAFGVLGRWAVFYNIEKYVGNGTTITIQSISGGNDEVIAYLATYILPIASFDLNEIIDLISLSIFFFITYKLYSRSKLLLVNPILGLKYSIYSFTFIDQQIQRSGIIISRDHDILEGDQVQIYNIGYQIYFGNKR